MNLALALFFYTHLVAADPAIIAPDTVVVCDPALRGALEPWVRYRQQQGHQIAFVQDFHRAEDIRAAILRHAAAGRLRTVVLVGDVGADPQPGGPPGRRIGVPTNFSSARINVKWGSEPEIATDNAYADLDGDSVPDVAIGRLSASNPEQLRGIVQKTIDYENSHAHGLWRRRVNFVAGVGGFGAIADAVLESTTRSFISQGIPSEFRTSMTYASWRSPYCPDPRAFRQTAIGRFNEGCFCWVYIGHGHRQGLDWVRVPTGRAPILQSDDVVHVRSENGNPIAVFLSCYAGAFDGPIDCLAERLLRQEQGPVAILAGSRVTMPYGMAVMSNSLMHHLFEQRQPTMGEIVLAAKQGLAEPNAAQGFNRRMLDTLAAALSPNPDDLEGERREHLELFNLLGDPLLRVRHPLPLEISTERSVQAGQPLRVVCRSEVAGECFVELVCRRGHFTYKPTRRSQFDGSHEGMRALTDEYRRANEDCFVKRRFHARAESFETTLSVPDHAVGHCHVRVFVAGNQDYAMGATNVLVAKPEAESSADASDSSTR